ncbi:hypothetical protein D3C78_1391040 [compost metagenome]
MDNLHHNAEAICAGARQFCEIYLCAAANGTDAVFIALYLFFGKEAAAAYTQAPQSNSSNRLQQYER